MRLNFNRTQFPRFADYLEKDMPQLAENGAVQHAWRVCAHSSPVDLVSYLKHPFIPSLNIEDVPRITGSYAGARPAAGFDNHQGVTVPRWLVDQFESGTDLRAARTGQVHLAGVYVLYGLLVWHRMDQLYIKQLPKPGRNKPLPEIDALLALVDAEQKYNGAMAAEGDAIERDARRFTRMLYGTENIFTQ